jgi:hypothetical protein
VTAVLQALGKKAGPEDDRTEKQRFHDALQLACELLLRARLVPDRAGSDTQVVAHVPLSQLRQMPGASQLEDVWIRALVGEDGYLAGKDAEAAACDAMTVPVVTGQVDLSVIDQMIEYVLGAFSHAEPDSAAPDGPAPGPPRGPVPGGGPGAAPRDRPPRRRPRLRSRRDRRGPADRAAGAPVEHPVAPVGHRLVRQHPGPHPPGGPAPRPALRLAPLQAPRGLVRRPPHRPQEGRRQDRRQGLRALVPVPP